MCNFSWCKYPLSLLIFLSELNKLSENFKDLFANKETCDVTFKVKDKEYKAHRSVLIARSSVFAATFRHNTLERQTGVITILDCDPVSFQQFLDYLYTGKLEELSFLSAQNLYYTSEKYDVQELKAFCVEYLMQCLTVENVCEIAVFADKYDETQLYKMVQDFFNKNSCKILLTSQWENLLKKDHRLANKLLREMVKNKT